MALSPKSAVTIGHLEEKLSSFLERRAEDCLCVCQVEWLREKSKNIPIRLVFESALELMSTTQLGGFKVHVSHCLRLFNYFLWGRDSILSKGQRGEGKMFTGVGMCPGAGWHYPSGQLKAHSCCDRMLCLLINAVWS